MSPNRTIAEKERPTPLAGFSINPEKEVDRITKAIRIQTRGFLRKGAVVAVSGGIDSSVVAALCARALGPKRVCALLLPERDSSEETLNLSRLLVECLGVSSVYQDITAILESVGCYRYRDEAIRSVIPEYRPDWKSKIVLPSLWEDEYYRLFSVIAADPRGIIHKERLTQQAYLGILSASNFKQRVRKMLEYYHADRLNFVVVGTPNRLEYDQGFFVKLGDGAADLKPIAHLYKSHVYKLAEYLNLPIEIQSRQPTTDTYSLSQSQEEFYFSLPYDMMDICLYGRIHCISPESLSEAIGLTPEQIARVYEDIDSKRKVSFYLKSPPLLAE